MLNFNNLFGPADMASAQIPPRLLANDFSEASVRRVGNRLQVAAVLAMGSVVFGDGEGCLTGLALDASQSMKNDFGRGRSLSADDSKRFLDQGLYDEVVRDGITRRVLSQQAKDEAKRLGLVRTTPNLVQDPAVKGIESLIRTFAKGGAQNGVCEVIYWACGPEGRDLEPLGEVRLADLPTLSIQGPQQQAFGPKTHLAPPFKHFAERARGRNGVYVFVTDGHIDDEADVLRETHRLAAEINDHRRSLLKCVLIGIGDQVDAAQFARIDDMEMPPGLENIDIWNSKVFKEMRDISDAWSEIFDPDTEVYDSAVVYNDKGEVVHQNTDRVKLLLTFEMPAGSKYFDLLLDGTVRVHQELPR